MTDLPVSMITRLYHSVAAKLYLFLSSLSALTGLSQTVLIFLSVVCCVFVVLVPVLIFRKRSQENKTERDNEPVGTVDAALDHSPLEPETAADGMAAAEPPRPVQETVQSQTGLIKSIRSGLEKTRKALSEKMDGLFSGSGKLDGEKLEELEELLITADVGVSTSMKLIQSLAGQTSAINNPDDLKKIIKQEIFRIINVPKNPSADLPLKPRVIMVVGVNGVGKTTTIGKLSARFVREGKKVLIVAGDTFRAAAAEQLAIWAERCGADIVRHKDNSDPAAVAFDGMEAALARQMDIVIIDTAGRLHTKINLMEELKKIKRTVAMKLPDAPHETLMVLDATTGQNALQQARLFNESIGISSIALTKLDGTAKGGIVIGISDSLHVPITYLGVGEQIDDLKDFDAGEFADALL